jgi:hypothetical protein
LFIHSGQFYQVEASVENFKGDELTAVVSRGNPSNKTSAVSRQKAAPRNLAASLRTKKDTRNSCGARPTSPFLTAATEGGKNNQRTDFSTEETRELSPPDFP